MDAIALTRIISLSDECDSSDTDQKLSDEYDNKSRRNKEMFRESGGPERD